jgi:hypothetical protein
VRNRVGVEGCPLFEGAVPVWHQYGPGFVPAPAARLTDPDTSHEAARSYAEHAWAQHPVIEGALKGLGRRGGTIHELAAVLGPAWDAVMLARRLPEMQRATPPRACVTAERRASPTGRRCQVWVHPQYLERG